MIDLTENGSELLDSKSNSKEKGTRCQNEHLLK